VAHPSSSARFERRIDQEARHGALPGQLVFQFMGIFRDDADSVVLEKRDPFLRLWPNPLYRAPWPPAALPLNDVGLEAVALSFAR
jgi:hypothetical protein